MNRYRFFRLLSRGVLKILFRTEVYGLENIPAEGPFILAPNHVSYIDPVACGAFLRRDIYYMARDSLFRVPALGRLIEWCNAFPVSRDSPGPRAMKKALSILAAGGGLLVFPEGKRSPDGELQAGTPGVGMLAAMSGAPIIPAFVVGTEKALPVDAKWIRFAKARVYFCRALEPGSGRGRELYQRTAEEVMERIRSKKEELGLDGQNNKG